MARSLFRRRYRYSFKYRYLLKRTYIFFIDCTEQSAIEGFDDHGFGVFPVVVHLSAIAVDSCGNAYVSTVGNALHRPLFA